MSKNVLAEMFGNTAPADAVGQVTQFEAYKAALRDSHAETASGKVGYDPTTKTLIKGVRPQIASEAHARVTEALALIEKSISGDQLTALTQDLQTIGGYVQGDITKDWTPSNPVGGTGLVPYDLEGPAKVLVPRYTPLRNSLPRVKGQGNARKFKRIDSYTNAGIPGGAAAALPFFASSTNTSTWGGPGNLTLNRPNKISYTGSDWSIAYMELGFSDQVNWQAQFQGLGFDDLRGLSHTSLLYSHLMGEERAILYARGAASGGYAGTVAIPGAVTSATATTGGTIAAATYSCYVVGYTGTGQTAPSTVATQVTSGATSTITITIGTEPAGAIYYGLYVGTVAGIANATLQTTFVGNTITITSYSVTATVGVAADSSFSALAYDGFLTVQADTTKTGYFLRANAAFSTTNPGSEFDTALAQMFNNNGADPDEIWMTAAMRKSYSQLMRIGGVNGASSGYRTQVVAGDGSATMGNMVTGHVNPGTGKVLDVNVHRFMLPGAALIRSTSLPVPDSHVQGPVQMVNVQDYMAIDWPTIQMTYDTSTYQIGTMEHIAPAWSGLLVGIWSGATAGQLT